MRFLGEEISGMFTIPSGIVTTNPKIIERVANEIPDVGVITTKSIGLSPREGYREPIITQYAPGCFMNAVGLTNPGADEFVRQMKKIKLPKNRFLLVSVFGKDADEFVSVAEKVGEIADGIELNLSCPHAKGYGMAIGQNKDLVKDITAAVKRAVNIPVIPKLTPNVPNIGEIAKAAEEGGADAICAINTIGPGEYEVEGYPVLSNVKGGKSGKEIFETGLRCVNDIRESTGLPIIACGGISNAEHVRKYMKGGASIFGVGSALAGMSTEEVEGYFRCLANDVRNNTNTAKTKEVDLSYKRYVIASNEHLADDLCIITCNKGVRIKPGQFIFVWIPGIGEKPFSVLDDNPLTLSIRKAGCFTEKLMSLKAGSEFYVRGPHGIPVDVKKTTRFVMVSGGCGLAALYQIARGHKNDVVLVGARDKDHLFYIEKLKEVAEVYISTDDGSEGYHGFVTELLKEKLEKMKEGDLTFFNCGPEKMVEKAVEIEKKHVSPERIFASIDYVTKCGIGLCGSCATPSGKRLCVDGPFIGRL